MKHRTTLLSMAAAAAFAVASPMAHAQAADAKAAKPAAKPAETAKKAPVSQSRKELKSEAKGLALATETVESISQAQLDIASRVLTGKADCEFNQQVDVAPVEGRPGFFKVGYKGASYTMVPQETTTGAVRLEDRRAGVMWLQIPSKSMLMNSKIGQRMVDSCMHAEQRAAMNAVSGARSN